MSGRTYSLSAGALVSASDAARIAAEEQLHARWQVQAAWVVAGAAHDAADCRLLLDVLGLDGVVVAAARASRPARVAGRGGAPAAVRRARRRAANKSHAA